MQYKIGSKKYNRFGTELCKNNRITKPIPLPSAVEVDLYYRGLPDTTTAEELDIIIEQENEMWRD